MIVSNEPHLYKVLFELSIMLTKISHVLPFGMVTASLQAHAKC